MSILRRWIEQTRGTAIAAVSIMLALALVASGCFPPLANAGADEKVVKIGLCATFLGPLATVGAPCSQGMIDYVRWVNDHGGIQGVKIEMPWYETRSGVADTITAHRKLVQQGIMIEQNILSTPAEALLPSLEKDEILLNCVSALTPVLAESSWVMMSFSDWPTAFLSLMNWAKKNLWTEARPMRVGTIFYAQASGYSTLDAIPYFDDIGIEFVGYEVVPLMGCLDASTELLRLAGKKADLIYLTSYGSPSVTVVKDAKRLGIGEKGIILFASSNTLDECILNIVKGDANGWFLSNLTPSYFETEKWPGLKAVIEGLGKYRGLPAERLKGFYTGGWTHTMLSVEAIRLAIEKVGYENLTGRAVRDAMYSITDFNTGILPPVTIRENTPYGANGSGVYEVREVKFQFIEWMTAFPSLYKEGWEKVDWEAY